jgi:hypothetical protein
LPKEFGMIGHAPVIIVDIGTGDGFPKMVDVSISGVCRLVISPILQSIAIHQRKLVSARCIDDVAVGGVLTAVAKVDDPLCRLSAPNRIIAC